MKFSKFYFICPLLIQIHKSLSATALSPLLFIVTYGVIFLFVLAKKRVLSIAKFCISNQNLLLTVVLLSIFIGHIRGFMNIGYDSSYLTQLVIAISVLISVLHLHFFYHSSIKIFEKSLLILVASNLIIHFILPQSAISSISSHDHGNSVLFGLLGMEVERQIVGIAGNLQSFGYVTGLIGIVIFFSKTSILHKSTSLLFFILPTIMFLDVRGTFVFAVLSILGTFFMRNKIVIFSLLLFCVLSFAIIPLGLFLINDFEFLQVFKRNDSVLFSVRQIVWTQVALNYNPDWLNFLFGYGFEGSFVSGISEKYSFLFSNWKRPEMVGVHNAYLEFLINYGFIPLLALILLFYQLILKSIEYQDLRYRAIITFSALSGITDGVWNIESTLGFYILLFILTNYVVHEYKLNYLERPFKFSMQKLK